MSLVAYSDDDSSEEESDAPNASTDQVKQNDESTSTFKVLPIPKTRITPSLNDLVLGKDLKGNVRITIPDLPDFEEHDDEEEERKKRIKLSKSATGSGLLSLLPTVSKSKVDKNKQLSMVPHSVSKPKALPKTNALALPKNSVNTIDIHIEDEDGADEQVEFFTFSEPTKSESKVDTSTVSDVEASVNVDIAPIMPTVGEPTASSSYDSPYYPSAASQKVSISQADINDPAYKRFIAQKFGEEPPEAINIIDINASKYFGESREYLKTITLEKPEEFKGIEPSSTAKRKHQITYLAFQAKQRELQLKNEWATNKVTKKQTRAKYGF